MGFWTIVLAVVVGQVLYHVPVNILAAIAQHYNEK
jgi:hypothetical protein